MYSLLVSSSGWDDRHDTLPSDRVLTWTVDEIAETYGTWRSPDFGKLCQLPALFVPEYRPGTQQVARLGTIYSARTSGREITLDYRFDESVPSLCMELIAAVASRLDIDLRRRGITELDNTHWAVKDADLYKVVLDLLTKHIRRPSAFDIPALASLEADLLSVMMPFDGFGLVYSAIGDAAADCGLRCSRADDIWEDATIIQDIVSLIDRSTIVVCDCTGRNPNVFYEIGIAHSLAKEVILITQDAGDIPFDLRHIRFLRYHPQDLGKLRRDLAGRIRTLMQS